MRPNIIRKLESIFHIDADYVLRNGGWTLLGQIITAITVLASTAILAHYMPQENFGVYRFVLAIIPLLVITSLPGVPIALTRAIAQGKYVSIHSIARIRIQWGLIGSAIALLLAGYYAVHSNTVMLSAFLLVAIFTPLQESLLLYPAYLKGMHNFKMATWYETLGRVSQALLLIGTVLYTQNIIVLVATYLIGIAVTRLLLYIIVFRNTRFKTSAPDATIETIAHSKELSVVAVLGATLTNIDKVIVWHYFGAAPLAVYTVAQLLPMQALAFLDGLIQVALPKLSGKMWDPTTTRDFLKRGGKLFIITIPITLIYILLAPFIFSVIFPSYGNAPILMTQIFAGLFLFAPINNILDQQLYADRQSTRNTRYTAISVIVFLILTVMCIPNMGVLGIAVAYTTKEVAVLITRMMI